jgi:hypothetical protein
MIDDPALLRYLQQEEARATDTTLNDERKTALEFYRGDLFGDEVDGRSKLRTRDVAEVVDYMLASILRTMVSSDKVVEFEPSQPEQDDIAQQITDRVHWNFLREQDGFAILRDGIKAGLIEKTGVWKSWVERPKVPQRARMNATQIEQAGEAVVDGEPVPEMYDIDDQTGEPLQVYDVVALVEGEPKFRDAAIPNEQFFCSPDTRTMADSPYCGDWSRKSIGELIEMGYPEDEVRDLYGDTAEGTQLSDARDEGRSERDGDVVRDDYGRQVVLREEYCRWFHQGRWQLVRAHRVNTSILSVEPAEDNPYTVWCPFPMPHRLVGQSLADKTMDIMVARSHMLRQAMDALYIANAPRMYIDMSQCDDTTLDDALDVAPGGLIRGRGPNAVQPFVQPFAAGNAFEAMQIMSGEKESRTGITRLNQGLDADALNKTATGTALMQASGQQMEEMVAREAANAVGEMFEKKLRLMTQHMPPHKFRTDSKVVDMQPQEWPTDLRLAVRVGLGSGNKDRKIQDLMLLKQTQGEAIQIDPRLVTPDKAFETAKLTTSILGLGPATQYFNDPSTLPPEKPQPDPEMAKVQAEAQQKQAEFQAQQQYDMAKLEMERQDKAAHLQLERDKAEAELALARERMGAEFALKREHMMYSAATNANMAADRPGGSLAQ